MPNVGEAWCTLFLRLIETRQAWSVLVFTPSLQPFDHSLRLFDGDFSIVLPLFLRHGGSYGLGLHRAHVGLFHRQRPSSLWPRKTRETAMSWIYLLSGATALAILVYLVVALLWPEKF